MLPVRRGGLFVSVFSCILLAELAVGRVMRERKLSSAFTGFGILGREEVGFVAVVFDRPSEPPIPAMDDLNPLVDARMECRAVAFCGGAILEPVVFDTSSCLAAEDAVGAVRREGRSTTRVGALWCGFAFGELLLQRDC